MVQVGCLGLRVGSPVLKMLTEERLVSEVNYMHCSAMEKCFCLYVSLVVNLLGLCRWSRREFQ